MRIHRFRHVALIGTAFVSLALTSAPGRGQMLVYDPSNYAQNVLQAARALQQINNQITSLQNQTQMLLNQARNLTSLPYSSLQSGNDCRTPVVAFRYKGACYKSWYRPLSRGSNQRPWSLRAWPCN